MMKRNPYARTLPQIFIDDELIGGYTDLIEKYTE
jgi:thioredoxin reductase (NADPH)